MNVSIITKCLLVGVFIVLCTHTNIQTFIQTQKTLYEPIARYTSKHHNKKKYKKNIARGRK